jgi:hypothetical protein
LITSPAADQSQLGYLIPCAPGESFYIEAQVKITDAAAGQNAGVYMWFLDSTGALVGGASPYTPAVAPTFADAGSLVANGGGETGTLGAQATSWTLNAGNGLLVANDFAKVGTKSLKITNGAAANSSNFQDVSVVVDQEYVLSGWIKTSALVTTANVGAILNIDIAPGSAVTGFTVLEKVANFTGTSGQPDVGVLSDGAVHDWTFVKCRFIPTGANGALRLFCQLGFGGNVAGSAWFDDVKVTPIFKTTALGTAPAGTVKVLLGLFGDCSLGAITVDYDAIYARRLIDSSIVAPADFQRPRWPLTTLGSGSRIGRRWTACDSRVRSISMASLPGRTSSCSHCRSGFALPHLRFFQRRWRSLKAFSLAQSTPMAM